MALIYPELPRPPKSGGIRASRIKTPESKDYPTTLFKKSSHRPSDSGSDPIGKDYKDLNFNSTGNSGMGYSRRGAISSGLGGNSIRNFHLIRSLASANLGDIRHLVACPGGPKTPSDKYQFHVIQHYYPSILFVRAYESP